MNTSGNFKFGIVAIIIAGALALMVALAGFASYVGAYNFGNEQEKALSAAYKNNQNVLSSYTLKVAEMAQVPEIARDDLKEVIQAQFEGRYGQDGSKATWQWLQEQNLPLNNDLYTRLQQTMEAGRNEFQVAQTGLLDKKRVYETALGSFWQGFWLRVAGYPKIDLAEIKIVTDAQTERTFATGQAEALQIRRNSDKSQ